MAVPSEIPPMSPSRTTPVEGASQPHSPVSVLTSASASADPELSMSSLEQSLPAGATSPLSSSREEAQSHGREGEGAPNVFTESDSTETAAHDSDEEEIRELFSAEQAAATGLWPE
eukprot:GFYU01033352.1.p2 GENE.GFYU01033352.1~~GFYU01033352.1.p2  ORF type:complete len:132 (-),score=16.01 GFYU01033352.1:24-371(-)